MCVDSFLPECFFLALPIQNRTPKTLPDRNALLLLQSRGPSVDLHLLLPTGGEAHIPPHDTAPTAMIVALIAEPAGDVTLVSLRANPVSYTHLTLPTKLAV